MKLPPSMANPKFKDKDVLAATQAFPNSRMLWLLQAGHAKYILGKPLVSEGALQELFKSTVENWDSLHSVWKPVVKPKIIEDIDFSKLPNALLVSLKYHIKKVYEGETEVAKATLPDQRLKTKVAMTLSEVNNLKQADKFLINGVVQAHGLSYSGVSYIYGTFLSRMQAVAAAKNAIEALMAKGYFMCDYTVSDVIVDGLTSDIWDALDSSKSRIKKEK